jgi:hypothetical protein
VVQLLRHQVINHTRGFVHVLPVYKDDHGMIPIHPSARIHVVATASATYCPGIQAESLHEKSAIVPYALYASVRK